MIVMEDEVKRTYSLSKKTVKQIDELMKFINRNNPRAPKASRNYVVQEAVNSFYDYLIVFEKEVKA